MQNILTCLAKSSNCNDCSLNVGCVARFCILTTQGCEFGLEHAWPFLLQGFDHRNLQETARFRRKVAMIGQNCKVVHKSRGLVEVLDVVVTVTSQLPGGTDR